MEPIEERMNMSKASQLVVFKNQRPSIWTEEAAGFHKKVKRIHDPMKIVVPCAVFEAESPIPPDNSVHLDSYSGILDDHQHIEASQRGLRFQDEVYKGPTERVSIDTIDAKSNDINKLKSIDTTTSSSIDTGRVLEHKEFDVCGNLRDGETTTRSDKSGGKKRRYWKKRKRIMDKKKDLRKTILHEDRRWPRNIDRQSITSIDRLPLNCVYRQSFNSIDRHLTVLVNTHIKVSISTDESMSISIDSTLPAATDGNSFPSIDT
uniref:Uncharacterized protein n=1 Tax=Brassica oleracea TaxID=3712 RepID=A0A3P6FCI3_BRAOL|nr:unnamed protein product [Brassica oleracea]